MSNKQDSKNTLWKDFELTSPEQPFTAREVNDFVRSAALQAFWDGVDKGRTNKTDEQLLDTLEKEIHAKETGYVEPTDEEIDELFRQVAKHNVH